MLQEVQQPSVWGSSRDQRGLSVFAPCMLSFILTSEPPEPLWLGRSSAELLVTPEAAAHLCRCQKPSRPGEAPFTAWEVGAVMAALVLMKGWRWEKMALHISGRT